MKSLQEVFNIVAAHLLKQNCQAKDGLSCRYRSDNGTKCAVGCLIDDRFYDIDMEGVSMDEVADLIDRNGTDYADRELAGDDSEDRTTQLLALALRDSGIDCLAPGTTKLLSDLQSCHDNEMPGEWRFHLETIAMNNKLNFNVQA